LIACLIGEEDKVIKEMVYQRKKQVHGMQQIREAENASLVGSPENIISGLNRYINVGITHFVVDFVGLSENTIKLFDSSVIKKI
jgi:alkanesulfonate monooxygenase SsuD/methylene tetrahydromethanopterin reductase-like flavin-dependent oxidoreductase (luciferase family)